MEGKKFRKPASITINGYLNFLCQYKKRFCGISPQDVIRFGAREWNKLTLQEKERYKKMKQPVAPHVFDRGSHGDSTDKSEREKRSPVRSRNKKDRKPCKSIKKQVKKKAAPPIFLAKKRGPTSSGHAGGFISFMRRFKIMNKHLTPNDLLKAAIRIWRGLQRSQRKPFEKPL
ncbi:protamine-like protein 99C [Drosophila subpulchrella]|uniref:protamine-like protein 99C n=1 Tax=Drosophila subpulchrella TaxID=1486046 RepID=UPI0018A15D83|nr:protamine-like protein 99C [Drosophila subpulchrella]